MWVRLVAKLLITQNEAVQGVKPGCPNVCKNYSGDFLWFAFQIYVIQDYAGSYRKDIADAEFLAVFYSLLT